MKRTLLAIISTFALFAQFATAQTSTQDFSKASVVIKFFDRTMYNTASADDNPVNVNVSIINNGTETLRFKLADDRMFSVDFEAYTLKNTALAQTKELIKKRSTNQTVYFREIAIEPGESYSFIENVKNYISFDEPSVYYFEAVFYPELYKSRKLELKSNRLSVDIRPTPSAASSISIPVETKTSSILKPESISPDKVITQTIIARQRSLWDQYFLYMDLQEMLVRNADTARRFRNASADERRRMVESYKTDLMQNRIDQDIVAIPEKFEIEKTSYSATNGEVSVIEWFTYPTFREKKRFTYKVRQRDEIWQIYDYTVENLGTEK